MSLSPSLPQSTSQSVCNSTHQPPRHQLLGDIYIDHESTEQQTVARYSHARPTQHLRIHTHAHTHTQTESEGAS